MNAHESIGKHIRDARRARGVTQQELADRIDLTRTSVANIEAGRQRVNAMQLAIIARTLRTDIGVLLRMEDLPPEPPAPPLPHQVTIRQVFEVTCETCGPGQPMDAARSRAEALKTRQAHIEEMQAKECEHQAGHLTE